MHTRLTLDIFTAYLRDMPRAAVRIAGLRFPAGYHTLPADITGNLNVAARTLKNKLKTFFYISCYS